VRRVTDGGEDALIDGEGADVRRQPCERPDDGDPSLVILTEVANQVRFVEFLIY
jgi:hypothetical protein